MTALLESVARLSERCRSAAPESTRSAWGQYFTSPAIASFMAQLVTAPPGGAVRVLDPGAGTGILGIAAAARILAAPSARVHVVAVEAEPGAAAHLEAALGAARAALGERLSYEVVRGDFLALAGGAEGASPLGLFDVAMANPPYGKVSPDGAGGGAPNAYARFMEAAARLLAPEGQLCFLVPRSFASGLYFRPFRRRFHEAMRLDHAHLFGSRRDAFRADGVLQENLVVLYRRSAAPREHVTITASRGERDLAARTAHDVPRADVLRAADPDDRVFLPADGADLRVLREVSAWGHRLGDHGLEVSTGPVVPFRAGAELVSDAGAEGAVPMLWLQHVRPGAVVWPLGDAFRKPERIRAAAPERLLVPNATYVLVRRFSAKEDKRRVVAAPLAGGALPGARLGLENHLNFIHRPGRTLDDAEARALARVLNSPLVDAYFRVASGNTQVSAAELRALPLPPPALLRELAQAGACLPGAAASSSPAS